MGCYPRQTLDGYIKLTGFDWMGGSFEWPLAISQGSGSSSRPTIKKPTSLSTQTSSSTSSTTRSSRTSSSLTSKNSKHKNKNERRVHGVDDDQVYWDRPTQSQRLAHLTISEEQPPPANPVPVLTPIVQPALKFRVPSPTKDCKKRKREIPTRPHTTAKTTASTLTTTTTTTTTTSTSLRNKSIDLLRDKLTLHQKKMGPLITKPLKKSSATSSHRATSTTTTSKTKAALVSSRKPPPRGKSSSCSKPSTSSSKSS
ncbi:hypothetical protein Pst134EA_024642 [Puccinia striiformis f. sp. tritici]|uniref:hypothetical protein n=1 Tax=Puccinia striiformis f. sp. tritici TaxID=168172 RepID=UPI00200740C9|nr:hypothetical protein Pst134EA_024642 [Puccinia striiformis f. sp. tritici]KAH9453777.1 hypothetical protein Pst134EA_024642 [Puccinia striiformis f. sp. tritici]